MVYSHTGKAPVDLREDPMSPLSQDWVYFVFSSFLRTGETITDHSATVTGGELVVDSTYIGTITDPCGNTYTNVYGVKVGAIAGSSRITVVLTFSTSVSGDVDIGRTDVTRTVIIPVRTL